MDTAPAPVKVIDGSQYGKHGYFVAIGPRTLLADAHATRTPIAVETGTATGDRITLLDYNPADPGHDAPYGEVKHWTADRGPYAGQEIAVYLVNTTKARLADAPILAAHIAKRAGENYAAAAELENRVRAEEAELSRSAD
jgi:hypothetical protein